MKQSKQMIAQESFNSGFNCAQSVLKAFSDDLGINEIQAINMASGFGAGMGRLQKTCGAVTGAVMVIGLSNNLSIQLAENRNDLTNQMIQDFENQFIKKHGTTQCKELIACDLNTEDGQNKFREQNIKEHICSKCIQSAVTILESF
jgi:C_GCAxxG_C_C family probable redox protein